MTTHAPMGAAWVQHRALDAPKITIVATARVSESALKAVTSVYAAITSRLRPDKSQLDGFRVYIVNGEPWSELEKLTPIGQLSPAVNKYGIVEGHELRGGCSGSEWLWLDEQMICSTGVATRNEDFLNKKREKPDNDRRTFDQVVHEFAHAIAATYGLDGEIEAVFADSRITPPAEAFAWAVQFLFGTPEGQPTDSQLLYLREIFTSVARFSVPGGGVTDRQFPSLTSHARARPFPKTVIINNTLKEEIEFTCDCGNNSVYSIDARIRIAPGERREIKAPTQSSISSWVMGRPSDRVSYVVTVEGVQILDRVANSFVRVPH